MSNPLNKAVSWYFTKRALPYWSILIIDSLIVAGSLLLIYTIANGGSQTLAVIYPLLKTISLFLICFLVGFRLFHTYSGVIRFSSFQDLFQVASACLTGLLFSLLVEWVGHHYGFLVHVSFNQLVIGVLLAMCLMWSVRIWVKNLYDNSLQRSKATRVFIYGVKQGGVALAKSLYTQENSPYILAGFVSDYSDIQDKRLMRVRVYPNDEQLADVMHAHYSNVLLVSPLKNEALRQNDEMVNRLISAGIKILMIPAAQEWDGKNDLSYAHLHEVNVEDLLPREKIEIDLKAVEEQLTQQSVLITGAAGSIGSEIVRQVARFRPKRLILIDQAETPLHDIRLMMARMFNDIEAETIVSDICIKERMEEIFQEYRPDYVFHAAAYKHVPMMEDNPGESIRNNVDGTRIIADMAVKYKAKKFVMVSTDKAVNPTNVMGCSKRICEIYTQSLDKAIKDGKVNGITQFVTTRFGNVLGSNGSVIPLFKEQIKQGGPVTVTHPNIIRFFMLIPEACKLVLEAGTMGHGGEIFVFDMGKPVKIVDLAKRMIQLSGAKDIEIKFTGLRDGEKLYEEVLNKSEITKPTFHPKIKIAQVRKYEYAEVCWQIDLLIRASLEEDDMQIVQRMKEMVPEFKSQHSKYEVLDFKEEGEKLGEDMY